MTGYPNLKLNQLYLLFNEWDKSHSDYFRIIELQTQPNGTFVFYCEEERAFYEILDIKPNQLEVYKQKELVLT